MNVLRLKETMFMNKVEFLEKTMFFLVTLKEMLGIYQPYEYSWMFLSDSTKYICQLSINIAALVIHMVGIHIQAELIQANLGFR